MNNSYSPTKWLMNSIRSEVASAALCCALPHWFDRELGVALISKFTEPSRSPRAVFADVLGLPFVYLRESEHWQYADSARRELVDELKSTGQRHVAMSEFVVSRLRDRLGAIDGEKSDSPRQKARKRMQGGWQVAYHLAPVNPEEAMQALMQISDRAVLNSDRLPEQRLIVQVWREQESFLKELRPHGAFLEGRYAYSRRDWDESELKFEYVWRFGHKHPLLRANAGHLLAVIKRRKGKPRHTAGAEVILRECMGLCNDSEATSPKAKSLLARVMNSLGATLLQIGGSDRIEEARRVLRRSVELHGEIDDKLGLVHSSHSLANALVRGGRDFREAERLLRGAIDSGSALGDAKSVAMLKSSLASLIMDEGDSKRYREAEELLQESWDYARERNDLHHSAIVSSRLGALLVKSGDRDRFPEAEDLYRQSFEAEHTLGSVEGQRRVISLLMELLVGTERESEAAELRKVHDGLGDEARQRSDEMG